MNDILDPSEKELEQAVGASRLRGRLIDLAEAGGAVDELLDSAMGDWPLNVPEGGNLRDAVGRARAAAEIGDSENSVGALAALTEGAATAGLPEVAAVVCAEARNLVALLGAEVDASDVANLENVTGLLALQAELPDRAEDAFRSALELAAGVDDRLMVAAVLLNLCNVETIRGHIDEARRYADESLAMYSELGERRGQSQLLLTLTSLALEQQQFDRVDELLGLAADLVPSVRDPGLTASVHYLRGLSVARQGAPDQADPEFRAALAAARRAGDVAKQASALQSLAAAANDSGRSQLARRRLIAAVKFAASAQLTGHLRILLGSLARAEHRAGNVPAALQYARQAAELAETSGLGLPGARALLAAALLDSGELVEGYELLRSTIPRLAQELQSGEGTEEDLAPSLMNLVLAHRRLGTIADGQHEIRDYIGLLSARGQADVLESLALALQDAGVGAEGYRAVALESVALRPKPERAWAALVFAAQLDGEAASDETTVAVLEVALATAQEERQEQVVLHARNGLALALSDLGLLDRALGLLHKNAATARELGDRVMLQLAEHNLSETFTRLDQPLEAEASARRSLELAEQLGDVDAAAEARLQLGRLASSRGDFEAARRLFETAAEQASLDRSIVASASSGLAGIAIAQERMPEAVTLYLLSLRGPLRPVHRIERLLGLCEAYAAVGNRRAFNYRLQQAVDLYTGEMLHKDYLFGMARSARRWADRDRPRFAGEILAIVVLLGALEWSRDLHKEGSVEEESSLVLALGIAGYELARQEIDGAPWGLTRQALDRGLTRHLEPEAVATLGELLDDATAASRNVQTRVDEDSES